MNKYVLTFIFLILCLLMLLSNFNCASMLKVSEHEFIDMYGKKHLYEEKIERLNKKVTYYCQKHNEWEIIRIIFTRDGIKYRVIIDELTKGE